MCRQVFVLLGMLLVGSLAASVPSSRKSEAVSQRSHAAESYQRSFPVNKLPSLTYSAKKYTVYPDLVVGNTAWHSCISMGKRLATIGSSADHKAVREAIAPYAGYEAAFWTSAVSLGAKPAAQDKFYWSVNSRPVGYLNGFQNWLLGVAPSESELCTALYLPSAVWISGPCDSYAYYVCEEGQDV